jgi:signal transduction histidine kinase
MNVLTNAVDAVGDQGRIHIRSFSEGESICVRIEDDGVGMFEEQVAQLFDL